MPGCLEITAAMAGGVFEIVVRENPGVFDEDQILVAVLLERLRQRPWRLERLKSDPRYRGIRNAVVRWPPRDAYRG